MLPLKSHLKPNPITYLRDGGPPRPCSSDLTRTASGLLACDSAVEDAAYGRHLAAIEADAIRLQGEQAVFHRLLAEGYRADAAKRSHWKSANVELQNHLKTQIENRRAEARLKSDADAAFTVLAPEKGTLKANSVAETLGGPVRSALTCPLKLHSITGFPTRGRHSNVTTDELLRNHLGAMDLKRARARAEREACLEEERRFLDHVNDEQKRATVALKARQVAANAELLKAWETSQHVKNLQKLQTFGSGAMLQYARSAAALPEDGFDSNGRETLRHPPTLPPARQLAATLAAAKAQGASDLSVGFDPKGAAEVPPDAIPMTGDMSKVLIDV